MKGRKLRNRIKRARREALADAVAAARQMRKSFMSKKGRRAAWHVANAIEKLSHRIPPDE